MSNVPLSSIIMKIPAKDILTVNEKNQKLSRFLKFLFH